MGSLSVGLCSGARCISRSNKGGRTGRRTAVRAQIDANLNHATLLPGLVCKEGSEKSGALKLLATLLRERSAAP
jgi:hypothetical protein